MEEQQKRAQELQEKTITERTKAANGCVVAALLGVMMVCASAIIITLIVMTWG
jgi:hypothetical protein